MFSLITDNISTDEYIRTDIEKFKLYYITLPPIVYVKTTKQSYKKNKFNKRRPRPCFKSYEHHQPVQQLEKSVNAWNNQDKRILTSSESIIKHITCILNKLTKSNYDNISVKVIEQIVNITDICLISTIIDIIINKCTFEPEYHSLYSSIAILICNNLTLIEQIITIEEEDKIFKWYLNNTSGIYNNFNTYESALDNAKCNINLFKILYDKCYTIFVNRAELILKSNDKTLSEDVIYKYRRQLFSNIEFIGELYIKSFISLNQIKIIINLLLNNNTIVEEDIESFCKLWEVIYSKYTFVNLNTRLEEIISMNILSNRLMYMLQRLISTNNKHHRTKPIVNIVDVINTKINTYLQTGCYNEICLLSEKMKDADRKLLCDQLFNNLIEKQANKQQLLLSLICKLYEQNQLSNLLLKDSLIEILSILDELVIDVPLINSVLIYFIIEWVTVIDTNSLYHILPDILITYKNESMHRLLNDILKIESDCCITTKLKTNVSNIINIHYTI
jgi:hypothetical protein